MKPSNSVPVLVIGFGSIGQRHAAVLQELGCTVSVLSHRAVAHVPSFTELGQALHASKPEYVVVANETTKHYTTLLQLADLGFCGKVLVEKPLFDKGVALAALPFSSLHVGYNMRFHPVLARLKQLLSTQRVLSVQGYVGQYLPEWRPSRDYRQVYSAQSSAGGGVLRDLSHELDYLLWLFGPWKRIAALGGHYSSLEIDSADVFSLLMETSKAPVVSLELNYLNRLTQRTLTITTDSDSLRADLLKGTLESKSIGIETFTLEPNQTYRSQHQAVLAGKTVLAGQTQQLCSLEQGLAVLELIESSERANSATVWNIARE